MAENNWNPALYQEKHAFVYEYGKGVLELLAPQAGERILDVGCGTGQLTAEIAQSGATVVGVDYAFEMLETARRNYPQIDFLQADAADFAFARPFDAVFSNAALHWVRRADEAARSIAAALKDGGRLIAELGGRDNGGNVWRTLQRVIKARLHLDAQHAWYFPTIGEYAALLERHRLLVSAAWLFERPTPLAGEDGMQNWITMFCGALFEAVPPARRAAVLDEALDRLRATNFRDGVWLVDYRRLRVVARKVEQAI